jgi:hypothetical protein
VNPAVMIAVEILNPDEADAPAASVSNTRRDSGTAQSAGGRS